LTIVTPSSPTVRLACRSRRERRHSHTASASTAIARGTATKGLVPQRSGAITSPIANTTRPAGKMEAKPPRPPPPDPRNVRVLLVTVVAMRRAVLGEHGLVDLRLDHGDYPAGGGEVHLERGPGRIAVTIIHGIELVLPSIPVTVTPVSLARSPKLGIRLASRNRRTA
jgi:hypothetical protein